MNITVLVNYLFVEIVKTLKFWPEEDQSNIVWSCDLFAMVWDCVDKNTVLVKNMICSKDAGRGLRRHQKQEYVLGLSTRELVAIL